MQALKYRKINKNKIMKSATNIKIAHKNANKIIY